MPLNVNSRANFALNKAFIAANMGKPVELSYVLIRGGRSFPSPALTASVGTIPDNHPSLPTPAMDGAIGNELDVTNLAATDRLRVGEWPQQVSGQCVWLRFDGIDTNGMAIFFEDRKGEPHTTLPGLNRPAPIDWLKTLKDGSVLTISFRVNYDSVANTNTAVRFPVRTYTVKARLPLTIDQSRMNLSGLSVVGGPWPLSGLEAEGQTETREATGGMGPYRYSSSNPSIASVDQNSGMVTGKSNGVAEITVVDESNAEIRYEVSIQNVFRIVVATGGILWSQSQSWFNATPGAVRLEFVHAAVLSRVHTMPLPFRSYYNTTAIWAPPYSSHISLGQCFFDSGSYSPAGGLTEKLPSCLLVRT